MSRFQIGVKKYKKLVINIVLSKQGLASRFEADQELGSLREEKEMFESSERQRDMFQRVSSNAQEIDDTGSFDDDHLSVRDGIMREVDVGTGLSSALKRLREQGTFKRGKSKLANSSVTGNLDDERFIDRCKDIRIDRVDEEGRILNSKEAHRLFSHRFYGKQPGKRKQEKRKKKHEDIYKQMETSDRAVERMREVHAISKSPYIVL